MHVSFKGDIAFRYLNYLKSEGDNSLTDAAENLEFDERLTPEGADGEGKTSHVTVCDINQAMLDVGKKKSEQIGFSQGVSMALFFWTKIYCFVKGTFLLQLFCMILRAVQMHIYSVYICTYTVRGSICPVVFLIIPPVVTVK